MTDGDACTSIETPVGDGQAPIAQKDEKRNMVELTRTNDLVHLSWILATLSGRGIEVDVLDTHTSIMEGSISAIPRRLMVREEDLVRAKRILDEAEALVNG